MLPYSRGGSAHSESLCLLAAVWKKKKKEKKELNAWSTVQDTSCGSKEIAEVMLQELWQLRADDIPLKTIHCS